MQVESLLEKKIPLISSSFTYTPKVAPIAVRRVPNRVFQSLRTQQNIDIIRFLQATLIEAELKITDQSLGTGMASTVSSDEDDKLAKTTSSPYQGSNQNQNNNSTLLPNKNKKPYRSLKNDREVEEVSRKRTKFSALTDSNSSEEDPDADDGDAADDPGLENKSGQCDGEGDKLIGSTLSTTNYPAGNAIAETVAPAVSETISDSIRENSCGDTRAASDEKSRDNSIVSHAQLLGKDERIDLYANNVYVAPEQALVTSVELVVPAPPQVLVGSGSSPRDLYGDINGELQYDAAVLFNSSGSANSQSNKIDGCARDTSASSTSSNLNIRIPTNLSLTTPGDILLSDHRRATIWAPHNESKETASDSDMHPKEESETVGASTESAVYPSADTYRTQQHQRQSELLLQIEKEANVGSATAGYAQMLPLSVQHHQHHQESPAQHHYTHQQTQPHHLDTNNQLQNSVYAQNMYVQNINLHQHQQPHSHEHQTHYTNYGQSQQHYSHEQLFGLHHSDQQLHIQHQHQQQQQQQQQQMPHHMELECHGHLQQRSSHSHSQQQQMQEAYHDLMMDEFHEDPSSAYKLTLSPANAKPENQDDGYETSAGDVLTPNSHSSSTHSVTPQHHMQHSVIGLMAQTQSQSTNKNDEQLHSSQNSGVTAANSSGNQIQVNATPPPPHLDLPMDRLGDTRNTASMAGVDPYSFMGEEIRMLSPASRQTHVEGTTSTMSTYASVPMSVPNDDAECRNDLYRSHPSQQQQAPQHYDDSKDIEANNNGKMDDMDNTGIAAKPVPKRRGRKKKLMVAGEAMQISSAVSHQYDGNNDPAILSNTPDPVGSMGDGLATKPKERKKHDRFNGMSEAEVIKRTIPDHLCDNLDIVIVGINPGLFAAYKGHHYAGPGNHFWKCLYLAGLTQEQMSADEDHKLIKQGIGFTNMVARATKGSADLTRKEIKEGSRILLEKLQRYRPKVAVFNGKLIFEVFSGKKEFHFGRQPDRVEGTDTYIWVMPSSSARCAQLPRAADKVPFYAALKKFRDYLNGLIPHIDDSECVFTEQRIRQCCEQQEPHSLNQSLTSTDQQANLLFVDSAGGVGVDGVAGGAGSGNSSQNVEKVPPHLAANESTSNTSIVSRGPFIPYGSNNAEDVMRSDNYMSVFGQTQVQPQEKKKRGRPKKIKGQELIDPTTGNKITIVNQKMPHHDFNNILNLSMLTSGNTGNGEAPKKKRGRPKKLKPSLDNSNPIANANGNPNSNSTAKSQPTGNGNGSVPNMHTLTMEHIAGSPQNSSHQVPPSLYNTPPPSHMLYTSSASPMASPALNCTYSHSQMPSVAQGTPPIGEISSPKTQDHLLSQKHTQAQSATAVGMVGIRDQPHPHLGETPPPNSPNMCPGMDFEPPDDQPDSQGRSGAQGQGHVQDQNLGVEKSQYASPAHDTEVNANAHAQEHYQQWLPHPHPLAHPPPHPLTHPHLQQNQQSEQKSIQHPSLHYQQEQSQPQQEHWPRYDDHSHNSSPYMLTSPHHHINLSPQLSGNNSAQSLNPNVVQLSGQQMGSDVARKSLSGLESLVDQIPAMSEHESNTISSATAAAAAAAVESRLLGLQQQQQQQQQHHHHQQQQQHKRCLPQEPAVPVQSESLSSADNTNAHAIANNFSVSNLATSASSTAADTDATYNSSPNPNSTRLENQSRGGGEYAIHSPTPTTPAGYPQHANHLISAAFAAASANNSQSAVNPHQHHLAHPHPHPPQHPQMYMDHAHITSHMAHMAPVNVNSMYGPAAAAYSTGPQHGTSGAGPADYYGVGVGVGVQGAVQGGPATLHVPSPNYPYAHPYAHTPPQANYPGYAHAHHHHHSHHPGHPTHHLSVFERLKPSDISGYTGF